MNDAAQEKQDYLDFLNAIENIDESDILAAKERDVPKTQNRPQTRSITLDLHGQTVKQARQSILNLISKNPERTLSLEIITGKGRHSGEQGGVLYKEIYQFVSNELSKYIIEIDDPPEQGMFGGLPMRGKFNVKLKIPK